MRFSILMGRWTVRRLPRGHQHLPYVHCGGVLSAPGPEKSWAGRAVKAGAFGAEGQCLRQQMIARCEAVDYYYG